VTSDSEELLFVKLRYKAPQGIESRLITHPVRDSNDRLSMELL